MTLHQAVQNYVYHRRKMEQCSLQAISDKFLLGNPDNAKRIVRHKKRHENEDLIREMNEHYHMHSNQIRSKKELAAEHGIGTTKLERLVQQERERYQ